MRQPFQLLIVATALLLSACATNPGATVRPLPFPQPPASLLAPTDKPTLLNDWQDLKKAFSGSLNAETAPSSGPKPAVPGLPSSKP